MQNTVFTHVNIDQYDSRKEICAFKSTETGVVSEDDLFKEGIPI